MRLLKRTPPARPLISARFHQSSSPSPPPRSAATGPKAGLVLVNTHPHSHVPHYVCTKNINMNAKQTQNTRLGRHIVSMRCSSPSLISEKKKTWRSHLHTYRLPAVLFQNNQLWQTQKTSIDGKRRKAHGVRELRSARTGQLKMVRPRKICSWKPAKIRKCWVLPAFLFHKATAGETWLQAAKSHTSHFQTGVIEKHLQQVTDV